MEGTHILGMSNALLIGGIQAANSMKSIRALKSIKYVGIQIKLFNYILYASIVYSPQFLYTYMHTSTIITDTHRLLHRDHSSD